MIQIVEKDNFVLYEIDEDCKSGFVPKDTPELSDMESWLVELIGKALMQPRTDKYCWCNGCFEWWYYNRKEGTSAHYRTFLTKNGILMYEDLSADKLYRVSV